MDRPLEASRLQNGTDHSVSIIVPLHRDGPALRTCLRALQEARRDGDELIVVVDGDEEWCQPTHWPGARVVRTASHSGPAAARNLGARLASGDLLLFVDSDVAVPKEIVRDVVGLFRAHPGVSAIIGSYDDAPAEPNFLSQYKNLVHHFVHQNAGEDGFTFWGACGAIRREAFLEIGGFDEKFSRPSIEDIELGYRLRGAGRKIWVCKSLQVKHLKRWTAAGLIWTDFWHRALPWAELILRSRRFENDLNIDRSNRAKVGLVYCLWAALAMSWSWPGALFAALMIGSTLLIMDARLLRFCQQKRGLFFAIRTIPWQWLYYSYCGLAFALGLVAHVYSSSRGHKLVPRTLEAQPVEATGS